jgi:hypothetical protein
MLPVTTFEYLGFAVRIDREWNEPDGRPKRLITVFVDESDIGYPRGIGMRPVDCAKAAIENRLIYSVGSRTFSLIE